MKRLLVAALVALPWAAHAEDKAETMVTLAKIAAYTKLCHKELSPAAKRGGRFIATAFGIDTKEGGELQFLIAERLVYLREHPELVPEFCTGTEKALISLENLGR